MKIIKSKILLIFFIISGFCFAQKENSITFSEVMFYPASGISNGEFIELYNLSSTDTLDLSGWKIRYYTSSPDIISDNGFGTKLLPNQFAIIFQGNYSTGYNIPTNCLKLKIGDNSFGTSGMSNSESRELKLISSKGDTICSYIYSVPNQPGYSDEKILLSTDNNSLNWSNSKILNGTPGMFNSVSPKMFDLAIDKIYLSKSNFFISDSIEVFVSIKNIGLNSVTNIQVIFDYDMNNDSIPEIDNLKSNIPYLAGNDSIILLSPKELIVPNNPFGVMVRILFPSDEDSSNNKKLIFFEPLKIDTPKVFINEIMFAPSNDQPEWIELFNNSDFIINLKDWKIGDLSAKNSIIKNDFYFKPKSYLILTSDNTIKNYYDTIPSPVIITTMPVYNNDKDAVTISNNKNTLIDSVYYYSNWGVSGFSIERMDIYKSSTDKSNWMISISEYKASPGKINSVKELKSGLKNSVLINEIMYNPQSYLSEYLEIKNVSSDTINLNGWKISINDSEIKLNKKIISPNSFLLLTADSNNIKYFNLSNRQNLNIFCLNQDELGLTNTDGEIKILDPFMNMVDSIYYFDSWHNPIVKVTKGRSLERISSILETNIIGNWSSSAGSLGGTPGYENSIFIKVNEKTGSFLDISPNPFSPDNDGFEDYTVFSYKLNLSSAIIRLKIFDSSGQLVKILADNLYSASEGKIIYNGLDENNNPLHIGIYIALFEASNKETGEMEKIKKVFVIARKL